MELGILAKRSSTMFLQFVLVLIGIGILTFLLVEPHLEGANAHRKFFEVYFDPFVAYVYASSIPFFTALYQAIKLLGYARGNKVFTPETVRALRIIKYCAFGTVILIMAAGAYIRLTAHGNDDPAGFLMLCMIAMFASVVVGSAALVFERILQ